jgi:hypothetical protein
MAPTRAWSSPKSTGERVTAAEFNALDDGQYDRLSRGGTSALTANSGATLGSYNYTFDGASTGRVIFADAWPTASGSIATLSNFVPPADSVASDGTKWDPKGLYWESNNTGTHFLYYNLSLPTGLVVTSISFVLLNASASGTPAAYPTADFSYQTVGGTSSVVIGSATDAPANLAAYQAAHVLTISGLSETIVTGRHYYLVIKNETGAGSQAGLRVYRPYLSGTLSLIRPA